MNDGSARHYGDGLKVRMTRIAGVEKLARQHVLPSRLRAMGKSGLVKGFFDEVQIIEAAHHSN